MVVLQTESGHKSAHSSAHVSALGSICQPGLQYRSPSKIADASSTLECDERSLPDAGQLEQAEKWMRGKESDDIRMAERETAQKDGDQLTLQQHKVDFSHVLVRILFVLVSLYTALQNIRR